MKILVTGATGFIGHNLVKELAKDKNNKIRCLVRNHDKFLNKWHKKRIKLLENLNIELIYGDLLEKESLKNTVKGIDIIYHLAAIARPVCIPDKEYFEVNLEGTKNLIYACLNEKIKKFIHISSISAIGPSKDNKPVNEQTQPNPIDTYGESKLATEQFISNFLKEHKFPITIIRPPMIYGPGDFEMLRMFKAVQKRMFPLLKGGKSLMEFCYVENLIQGIILAAKKGKSGEIYHISDEKSYTVKEVLETIAKIENVKPPRKVPILLVKTVGLSMEVLAKIFKFHPPFCRNTTDWLTTNYWISNTSKAKKELGYKPNINLEQGINRTINWYKTEGLL